MILIFFVLIFVFFIHPFEGGGDFYHHVNTGRLVVETHSLPNLDKFSHSAFNRPWIAHSWLSGLIFYLVLESLGETGITLLTALVATLTFYLLYILLQSLNISKKAAIFALTISATVVSIRFPQRPEMFSYPLVISLLLIDRFKKRFTWLPFLYPFLTLLWANLYGASVILGLGLITILALKKFFEDGFKLSRNNISYYALLFSCYPTSLLNGYGLKSIFYLYLYIPGVSSYESEWAGIPKIVNSFPLSLLINYQYLLLIFAIFLIGFILITVLGFSKIKNQVFLSLLSLSLLLPFFTFRHLPMAAILSTPIFAYILSTQSKEKKIISYFLTSILILLTLSISLWLNPPNFKKPSNLSLDQMINFIKDHKISGKAFNHLHFGGYLTYKLYPDVLVFYDTRDELYLQTDATNDLYNAHINSDNFLKLIEKYKIDLIIGDIITDNLPYRELFYSKDWAIVYFSDRYFLAVPKEVAKQKNLTEIDMVDPFSESGAKPGLEKKAVEYYTNQASLISSTQSKIYLASVLLTLEEYDDAIKILSSLDFRLSPQSFVLAQNRDYLLSSAHLNKGNCKMAKNFLTKALQNKERIIIWPFKRYIPSKINKGFAFYNLVCSKNKTLAKKYLDLYSNQPEVTPLERLVTQRKFAKLSGNI